MLLIECRFVMLELRKAEVHKFHKHSHFEQSEESIKKVSNSTVNGINNYFQPGFFTPLSQFVSSLTKVSF
jgi:hypothetical protein